MLVRDVMKRDVMVVRPELSLREAAERMWDVRDRLLIVGDKSGIHGFFTLRELVLGAEAQAQGHPVNGVGDVACGTFVITWEDETVTELAQRMIHAGARRAIVVDGEQRALGLVSPLELALHLRRSRRDAVEVASQESFPASDAPAWTGITAG